MLKDHELLKAIEFKFISKNQRIKDLEKEVAELRAEKALAKQEKNSS